MNERRWRRLENLFHDARELAPAARPAFLDKACDGDTELRRDVEFLLSGEAAAGSFLEAPALEDMVTATSVESLIGRQFGSFQITSMLGAGGMGEVYCAHDRKLGRDVAIKILPFEFASHPDRLARFRREARTLASLNHPNIAAIYGVEESGGVNCLVLELVGGDTLAERLRRDGPFPLAGALECARQICQALEAAHARGIVHRDLKPANVKVTVDGHVKVLDFGLAKVAEAAERRNNPTRADADADTVTGVVTLVGHVVGTPGYMSPEQARGQHVDKRTDVWAFGCLLYELLTGKPAFEGKTFSETVAAVLEREPDWRALPEKTPATVRALLRKCLEKDADTRVHSLADARASIEDAQRGSSRWRLVAAGVAALVILAALGVLGLRGRTTPSDPANWQQITKFPDSVTQPALSPDGRMVAFVRGPSAFIGPGQIYVKILPDGEPVQLTHDDVAKMHPMFSPDGTRIAYTTYMNREFSWDTWIVPVLGGQSQPWLRNASGLTWTRPGQLLFSEIRMGLHMGVVASNEARIGEREVYLPMAEPSMAHRSYLSPDGKWALIVEMDEDHLWEPCRVVPADGSSAGRKVGPPGGGCTSGAWSLDGKSIYLTSNAVGNNHIWRQAFPDGPPEQLTFGPTEQEGIAVAPDGRSIITAVALQTSSLWVRDAAGEKQISLEGNAAQPKFTPDGKKLLYRIVREPPSEYAFYRDLGELRVADLTSGRSEPVVANLQVLDYDISGDGREVVMEAADRDGKPQLWLASLDRSRPPRQIPNVSGGNPRFLPGDEIIFRRVEGSSAYGSNGFVYRARSDGTGVHKAFEQPVLFVSNISPDGKWLVAWAPRGGDGPPAFQAFPLDGGSPVTIAPAILFDWAPNGSSLAITSSFGSVIPEGRSYLLPLSGGQMLPDIPADGFQTEAEVARIPGIRRIDLEQVMPGPIPETYAFYRGTIQRNLYRIPLQ